jgi:hypothetical protein
MAKTKITKQKNPSDAKFMDFLDIEPEEELMLGMMDGFIEAARYQQQQALELTKLVVENIQKDLLDEETIFSIFQKSSNLIHKTSPIKDILEKA